jgi:hypothetical protein
VRYDRAGELEQLLRKDIAELLQRAERSDNEPAAEEQTLPKEIARRERLLAKMQEARRQLEERARGKDSGPEGPAGTGSEKGTEVGGGGSSSAPTPKDSQQINLTDPDSSLMCKRHHDSCVQAYNTRAVVDADGSQPIVATDVQQTPADSNQLEVAVHGVSPDVGEAPLSRGS